MNISKQTGTSNDLAINTIVDQIWKNGPISRAELSRLSGFSRSTITLNVDRLLKIGIINEAIKLPHNNKSKRKYLEITKDYGVIVGIEMGATSCSIGLCTLSGDIEATNSFQINYNLGPHTILEQLVNAVNTLIEQSNESTKRILGIGIGLPSPVDFTEGYAVHPAFMLGWHQFPIKSILQNHYHCPVFVDNEVNTMALGQSYLSEECRDANIIFVKAGSAIGAGIIIHGEIYRGNSGLSGNIGHILIDGRTEKCKCGKLGCLEAIAGGVALGKQAEQAAKQCKSTILQTTYKKKGFLDASDIQQAAAKGDVESLRIIQEAGQVLGKILGKLIIFFDPKAVIIGGGLTGFGPQYISYIRESIIQQCTPWIRSDFSVRETEYGSKIGILGSAMLCIKQLFDLGYLV
jgi:glucokinase-like ROK family protein